MKLLLKLFAVFLLAVSVWIQPTAGVAQQPAPQRAEEPKTQAVYSTRTGKQYHRDGCRYLAQSKIPITLKDAKARGFTPCKVCRQAQ
jgi:competence protein ComEC